MNCCNHNEDHNNNTNNNSGHKNHGRMGHMWMMVLCCGAPIILLAVISFLGTSFPGVRSTLVSILPFLCPVMMIAMIPMMFRKNTEENQGNNHEQIHQDSAENDNKFLK